MRDFLPSFALASLVIGLLLVWELRPPSTGSVIAVLGPDTTLRQTVIATDAYLIRTGPLPNSYVLFSRSPDFPARLRQAGAALVIRSDYSGTCAERQQISQSNAMQRSAFNRKRRLHVEIS